MAKLMNRQKKSSDPEQGQFGEALQQQLEEKGITIQVFSEKIGVTYEHVRRLIKSMAFPSKPLMGMMAQELKWTKDEAEQMKRYALSDKLKHKYSDLPQQLYGQDPRFERINRHLAKLNAEKFEIASRMIETLAKSARA